jgi:antitoxin component YwqK of YwqJK toxin-antitoxin module
MKALFILSIFFFVTSSTFAQIAVDISKTKKATVDGTDLTMFEDKPLTGFLTESFPNGKPKLWVTVKNGLANGLWQEWLENGHLRYNAYWLQGKGHGLWQYFHDNGVLKYEESYIMDIPNGISRAYYNSGKLQHDFFYLNGKKEGTWRYYAETGILLKTEFYENGILISTIEK